MCSLTNSTEANDYLYIWGIKRFKQLARAKCMNMKAKSYLSVTRRHLVIYNKNR